MWGIVHVPVSKAFVKSTAGPPPVVVKADSMLVTVETAPDVMEERIDAATATVAVVCGVWYVAPLSSGEQPRKSGMLTL
jgi:hypothetical protein